MTDYEQVVNDLLHADDLTADHKLLGICARAAAAIKELQNALANEYKDSNYVVSELESCVRTLAEQRDFWRDKAEKIEMQDKSISKFADGEWWKEAQE